MKLHFCRSQYSSVNLPCKVLKKLIIKFDICPVGATAIAEVVAKASFSFECLIENSSQLRVSSKS